MSQNFSAHHSRSFVKLEPEPFGVEVLLSFSPA